MIPDPDLQRAGTIHVVLNTTVGDNTKELIGPFHSQGVWRSNVVAEVIPFPNNHPTNVGDVVCAVEPYPGVNGKRASDVQTRRVRHFHPTIVAIETESRPHLAWHKGCARRGGTCFQF